MLFLKGDHLMHYRAIPHRQAVHHLTRPVLPKVAVDNKNLNGHHVAIFLSIVISHHAAHRDLFVDKQATL